MEPKLGEIRSFAETKCPCCGAGVENGAGNTAFVIDRMWNGREWIPLESYEGGWLARRLAGRPVEPLPQS